MLNKATQLTPAIISKYSTNDLNNLCEYIMAIEN